MTNTGTPEPFSALVEVLNTRAADAFNDSRYLMQQGAVERAAYAAGKETAYRDAARA